MKRDIESIESKRCPVSDWGIMNHKPPNANAKKETLKKHAGASPQTDIRKPLQRVLGLRGRHIGAGRRGWRITKILQCRLVYERSLLRLLVLLLLCLALVQDAERQPVELPFAALRIQRPDCALLVDAIRHVLLDLVGDRLAPLVELPELEVLAPPGAPDGIKGL